MEASRQRERLNLDCLEEVCGWITDENTLFNVSLTCKRGREPGQRNLFRHWNISGREEDYHPDYRLYRITSMLRSSGCRIRYYVKHLTLSNQDGMTLKALMDLLNELNILKTLEFELCTIRTMGVSCVTSLNSLEELKMKSIIVPPRESTVAVEEIFKLSKHWLKVDIDDVYFAHPAPLSLAALRTTSLTVGYTLGIRSAYQRLQMTATDNVKLSSLTVEFAKIHDVDSLALLIQRNRTTLNSINIGCGITSEHNEPNQYPNGWQPVFEALQDCSKIRKACLDLALYHTSGHSSDEWYEIPEQFIGSLPRTIQVLELDMILGPARAQVDWHLQAVRWKILLNLCKRLQSLREIRICVRLRGCQTLLYPTACNYTISGGQALHSFFEQELHQQLPYHHTTDYMSVSAKSEADIIKYLCYTPGVDRLSELSYADLADEYI